MRVFKSYHKHLWIGASYVTIAEDRRAAHKLLRAQLKADGVDAEPGTYELEELKPGAHQITSGDY